MNLMKFIMSFELRVVRNKVLTIALILWVQYPSFLSLAKKYIKRYRNDFEKSNLHNDIKRRLKMKGEGLKSLPLSFG